MPTIWGIADLHLGGPGEATRERFGKGWADHRETIARNWRERVGPGDLVLMPGDFSAARTHRDVQADLAWLEALPGLKVLSAGNHDRWWNRIEAIRPLLRRSQRAVGGDAIEVGDVVVCGTRGAPPIGGDPRVLETELESLDRALGAARALRRPGQPLYVLWHYPPFDRHGAAGPAVPRLEATRATACVYGHVHRSAEWSAMTQGLVRGVRYACVAADAIGFWPLRIEERGRSEGST